MLKDDLIVFGSEYPGICELMWRTVPVISVTQKYSFNYWIQLRNKSEVAGWAVGSHVLNEGQRCGALGLIPSQCTRQREHLWDLKETGICSLEWKTQELFLGMSLARGAMVWWWDEWWQGRVSVLQPWVCSGDSCVVLSHWAHTGCLRLRNVYLNQCPGKQLRGFSGSLLLIV